GRSFFIKNNFEDGQVAVLDILLKHAAQVAAGLPVDIIHDVIIIYRLVEELLVEATKDAAPAPIVVDNGAYHVVQHAAFVVHVARAFLIDMVIADQRGVIADAAPVAVYVFLPGLLAVVVVDIE